MNRYKFTECVKVVGNSCPMYAGKKIYISTGTVATDVIDETKVESVAYNEKPSRANLVVDTGTLLFAKMQATKKIMLVDDASKEYIYSTGFCAVKPIETIISHKCLYHLLTSKMFLKQKDKNCSGATQKAITKAGLDKIFISVPVLEKQDIIARKLDLISELIKNQRKVLEELDILIKSRFVEMFGDTLTNPKGWKECCLNEYIDFITSGSRGWAKYFTDDESELFITIKNVKNNHISLENIQYINAPSNKEAERTRVRAGDLLISITADLGRTGVVDREIADMGAYINQHLSLVRLRTNDINPLYVSYYLETEGGKVQFDSKNQNGVKAGLNFDAIKSLKILVPPKELQEKYVLFVKEIDKLKVACC